MTVRFWPILLKKSAMVSTAEKLALEIEIFTFCRGFRAQISRSCAQKKAFSSVSTRAVWKYRLFQHNRPIAACRDEPQRPKLAVATGRKRTISAIEILATDP